MKVISGNEDTKNKILRTARNLKDTKYKNFYIDLAVREREHGNVLMIKGDKKKSEDLC